MKENKRKSVEIIERSLSLNALTSMTSMCEHPSFVNDEHVPFYGDVLLQMLHEFLDFTQMINHDRGTEGVIILILLLQSVSLMRLESIWI